jgi:hypothetical protein
MDYPEEEDNDDEEEDEDEEEEEEEEEELDGPQLVSILPPYAVDLTCACYVEQKWRWRWREAKWDVDEWVVLP